MSEFVPLPEPYASWYTARVWAFTSPMEVSRREPVWRIHAHVPAQGWAFNYQIHSPGWRKLPEMTP